ncbi:ALF repeat-containing protein [Streptomyces actuosus]|uniref:ALF repeat-containing protein n=1 Tax=Streptomyces actuosus TaxID=1885 RepID=A0ABS2VYN0_STRAS|nr:ALF repeat-containing protein [Streptomyces actuosus]MBN0048241.1 ALF repeat-containing protein [Streptomyces actuosus]
MPLSRAALALAAAALIPTLLAAPAFAADSPGTITGAAATAEPDPGAGVNQLSDDEVRLAIMRILADPETGPAVRAAAQAAMDGTIVDQRYFLETGRWVAQFEDDRVAVSRILYLAQQNNDRTVVREAGKALETDTPEALRTFLETGYRLAQAEDDRVAILRILADPTIGDELRAAAQTALDDGSPEALRFFLEHAEI